MSKSYLGYGYDLPHLWDTFLDTPSSFKLDDANVVLIPVPYDSTTSYKSGSRHGPRAILEASHQLENYDLELDRDVSKVGIYTAPSVEPVFSGPKAMVERVQEAVSSVAVPGRIVGLIGGEHSISVGSVLSMRELYPDLSVLYLDAHADLRDKYLGTRWGHASVARRLFDICPIVQIGVRSLSNLEHNFVSRQSLPVIYWPPDSVDLAKICSDIEGSLSKNVYISIDLDVFDPSVIAAVGNPEPGGMTWADVTGLLRHIAFNHEIVGFDITELSPQEGPEASAYTASKLVYKLIGYATENKS